MRNKRKFSYENKNPKSFSEYVDHYKCIPSEIVFLGCTLCNYLNSDLEYLKESSQKIKAIIIKGPF